jgi:hypothetical protein
MVTVSACQATLLALPCPLVPTLFGGKVNQSHFLSPTGIVSLYLWELVNSLNHGHTHTNNATLQHPTCGKLCQSPRSRLPSSFPRLLLPFAEFTLLPLWMKHISCLTYTFSG